MAINTREVIIVTESDKGSGLLYWLSSLFAAFIILLCLAVGIVGLLLPVIPGLLFLLIAAMLAARLSPALDRRLRKYPQMRRYLDSGHGFLELNWREKIRFIFWLILKVAIDLLMLLFRGLRWLLQLAELRRP